MAVQVLPYQVIAVLIASLEVTQLSQVGGLDITAVQVLMAKQLQEAAAAVLVIWRTQAVLLLPDKALLAEIVSVAFRRILAEAAAVQAERE